MLKQQEKVAESWNKAWEEQILQSFIPKRSQWTKTDDLPQAGDICIFQRTEMSLGGPTYRIGRVREAVKSKDGLVRKLILEYKNANEKVFRTTDRNPRQTAILHRESEVELTQQLNIAAKEANLAVMGKSTS